MSTLAWALVVVGAALAVYAAFLGLLVAAGRHGDARAIAGFVPDCVVLFRRLLADERVPRSRRLVLVALVAYLAMPFDVVPDFIPVAGQLDDAIAVALALRLLVGGAGEAVVREHWPGPQASLELLLWVAYARPGAVRRQRGG